MSAPTDSRLNAGQFHSRIDRRYRSPEVVLSDLHHAAPRRLPAHAHALGFFSLLISGAYREEMGRRKIDYRRSTVVFHPPEETHRDEVGREGMQLFCVEVEARLIERVREHAPLPLAPVIDEAGEMSWLALRLYRELRHEDALSPLAVEGLTLELLACVGRAQPGTERLPPPWMRRLLSRLDAEFARPLTLTELARDTGLHPVHVSRTFRRLTGRTLGEHVQALRVAFACRALLAADCDLSEVALASGFSDQSHLTRVFKRHLGVTPGRFRKSPSRLG